MFSWGEDTRRGFGFNTVVVTNPHNGTHFIRLKSQIQDLSAGNNVAAFIRNGKVSIVRMREAQDGTRVSGRLKSLSSKEKIRAVSCGDDEVVLLSEEGRLLYLTLDTTASLRPLNVPGNRHVSQVACGSHHSIVLTKDGQVFTWGQNSSGQLGLGAGSPSVQSPQLLQPLSGLPLGLVTAGGDQSFALSLSGSAFGWGKNCYGQLGLGDTADRYTPTAIHSLNMKKTLYISCGKDHTVVLTKGGTVLTFGSGRYGQLGHNSLRDELYPRVVGELWGAKVTKIACGRHHTLVLTESKRTYSFGRGEQGQLGNGDRRVQSVPLRVQLSQDTSAHQQIDHIYAGGNHSFATCSSDQGSENLRVDNVTQEALDDVIDTWSSECDSKPWRKIQKEIKRMFSSTSCVNRSFLDKSGDKHFQTSAKHSGLNVEHARCAFKKVVKKASVWAEVESVLLHQLLPSLNKAPVGVEGLRVYLLLTELLHVCQTGEQTECTELLGAVAAAILRLPAESLRVLGDWWSSLKPSTMIEHVQVWKQALSWILVTSSQFTHSTGCKDLLKVLQHLYNANEAAEPRRIAQSTFCLEELRFTERFLQQDVNLWRSWLHRKDVNETPVILCRFPFVMNLQCKIMVFDINTRLRQAQHQPPWAFMLPQPASATFFELRLKRTSLVEDTFDALDAVHDHRAFKKPLVVYFDEESKLTNVYKKDFFHQLFDELLLPESGMFIYNDTKSLAWFPSERTRGKKRYFLFGVLCGLALYNQDIIHLPFPMALFKKMLHVEPSLDDLMEFSPDQGRSLRYILEDYVDDDIENLYMYFSIVWDGKEIELDPQNPGKPVTSENKNEFVDAYVNYAFNTSVAEVFEEFTRGFFQVCDLDVVELFQPEELRGLTVGKDNYDWGKLKQNTVYELPYHAGHPTIAMFWQVFGELTEDQRKAFLLFLTGCDRVPIHGMDQVRMRVRVLIHASQQHFPEALTCHSILDLPIYSTRETLSTRLIAAISDNRGFV